MRNGDKKRKPIKIHGSAQDQQALQSRYESLQLQNHKVEDLIDLMKENLSLDDFIKYLDQYKIEVNSSDSDRLLIAAAKLKKTEIARHLILKGNKVDEALDGWADEVNIRSVDDIKKSRSKSVLASEDINNYVTMVKTLFNAGAPIKEMLIWSIDYPKALEALVTNAQLKPIDVIKTLISAKSDITKIFRWAHYAGHKDAVDYLVKIKGSDLTKAGIDIKNPMAAQGYIKDSTKGDYDYYDYDSDDSDDSDDLDDIDMPIQNENKQNIPSKAPAPPEDLFFSKKVVMPEEKEPGASDPETFLIPDTNNDSKNPSYESKEVEHEEKNSDESDQEIDQVKDLISFIKTGQLNVNAANQGSLLQIAIETNNYDFAQFCIKNGANINNEDNRNRITSSLQQSGNLQAKKILPLINTIQEYANGLNSIISDRKAENRMKSLDLFVKEIESKGDSYLIPSIFNSSFATYNAVLNKDVEILRDLQKRNLIDLMSKTKGQTAIQLSDEKSSKNKLGKILSRLDKRSKARNEITSIINEVASGELYKTQVNFRFPEDKAGEQKEFKEPGSTPKSRKQSVEKRSLKNNNDFKNR